MSRSFRRAAPLVVLLLCVLPAVSSGRTLRERETSVRRLVLRWCDPHALFQHGSEHIGHDLSRLSGALGVEVLWWTGSDGSDSEDPLSSDLVIRVVLVRSEPSQWNLSPEAMGAVLSQNGPQSEVYVFFDPVVRILGYSPSALHSRWPTLREERDLSRALSRVILHEVLHAVLPGTSHASVGLTRARLDRESLLAETASIDPKVAGAFRAALGLPGATPGDRLSAADQGKKN
jgi:hypothetical protein